MATRKLIIERRKGQFGRFPACAILSDEKRIGEMAQDQMKGEFAISKGEHAIQAQIEGPDGRFYRSNSYFSLGGKDVVLYLTIDGSKLVLAYR